MFPISLNYIYFCYFYFIIFFFYLPFLILLFLLIKTLSSFSYFILSFLIYYTPFIRKIQIPILVTFIIYLFCESDFVSLVYVILLLFRIWFISLDEATVSAVDFLSRLIIYGRSAILWQLCYEDYWNLIKAQQH